MRFIPVCRIFHPFRYHEPFHAEVVPVATEGILSPLRHWLPDSRRSPNTYCTIRHSCFCSELRCPPPLEAFPAQHPRFSPPDRRGHRGSPVWPFAAVVVVVACGGMRSKPPFHITEI